MRNLSQLKSAEEKAQDLARLSIEDYLFMGLGAWTAIMVGLMIFRSEPDRSEPSKMDRSPANEKNNSLAPDPYHLSYQSHISTNR
jgi:hypothetical protein